MSGRSDVDGLSYGDDRHMLLLAAYALEVACRRLDAVSDLADPAEVFGPLQEVLWWAESYDEGLRRLEGLSYSKRRDADSDGRVMPGVSYARNRGGHYQALMLASAPGAELGRLVLDVSRLDTTTQLIWRPFEELPAGKSDRGRESYARHLAGKPVRGTVASVRAWVHAGSRRVGPLAIGMHTEA